MMSKKFVLQAAFLAAGFTAGLFALPATAAVTNVITACGTDGNRIVPSSHPGGGVYTNGQTVTFSGTVNQVVDAAVQKATFRCNKMEFYIAQEGKLPLIDACNDENYDQESCLMWSCSNNGACPSVSPTLPASLTCPSCKWGSCSACCSKIQDACTNGFNMGCSKSSKLLYCDEVDTVRTDGAVKAIKLGEIYPSDAVDAAKFNYNASFVLPSSINFSGSVRFIVYYRGIIHRKNITGQVTPEAWTWQAAYDTATFVPCTCGVWSNQSCGSGGCSALQRYQARICSPANCSTSGRCVSDPSCCQCTAWTNAGCGVGGCGPLQNYQTRTCTAGCQAQTQCVNDANCCQCTAWSNGTCGIGGCGAMQRQQTRTCTAGCQAQTQCVDDATCCQCGAWSDGACGAGGCQANQRQVTRSCSPANCQAESQCVDDTGCTVTLSGRVTRSDSGAGLPNVTVDLCGKSATTDADGNWTASVMTGSPYCARLSAGAPGGYSAIRGTSNNSCYPDWSTYEWQVAGANRFTACGLNDQRSWDLPNDNNINFSVDYPPACVCEAWTNGFCGSGGCSALQRQQTRTCSPANCQAQSQCIADTGCGTLGVTVSAAPNSGTVPLDTTLKAEVTGTAEGTINYTVWWNCASTCDSVSGCVAACGDYDIKADGQTSTIYTAVHTYAAAGVYLPKVVVERGAKKAEGQASVNVADAPGCTCSSWIDSGCGTNGCDSTVMGQTRACNPVGCDTASQCIGSDSCSGDDDGGGETLNVTLNANPVSGAAPLEVRLEAAVSGSANGSINYTFWWNCANSCDTLALCRDACGTWDHKDDNKTQETYTINHTYSGAGSFMPKVVAERGTKAAADKKTVTVAPANGDPEISGGNTIQGDHCQASPAASFAWIYSDPDGDAQKYYRVQVSDSGSFSSLLADSGQVESNFSGFAVQMGTLAYDTSYFWRVKVWDARGAESDWYEGASFSTPPHQYPAVDFNWVPMKPTIEEDISFEPDVEVFGGAAVAGQNWSFEGAIPSSSAAEEPVVQYAAKGDFKVRLSITDSSGFTCSKEKMIKVKRSLPDWEEIIP